MSCRLGQHGVPAKGWLVGEVHNGIAQMFDVIEQARMMVGTKAIATLSTGYLNALEYAKSRVQGADLTQMTDKTAPRVTITHHPDVRRSLMTQKSYAEGLRALYIYTAHFQDDEVAKARPRGRRRAGRFRSTTCCCRSSRVSARRRRTPSSPRACRPSVDRASCRTTRSSSTTELARLQHFGPNWFASVMGTGIVATAGVTLPVHVPGLHVFSRWCGWSPRRCW